MAYDPEIEADVVVAGAGPAGAAFALNLAPLRRVLIVDTHQGGDARIGESLAPASRRLLTDMALWQGFLEQAHRPSHGGRSVWGGPSPVDRDNLRDLDGPGWHLDRLRFDAWLRDVAVQRGAAMLVPARAADIARAGQGWRLRLEVEGRSIPVRARFLVDAGGRASPVARALGARRIAADRLVCGWMQGRDGPGRQSGLTHIEAEPDGWWYSAPLPGNRRVVAFHTDSDLPAASDAAAGPAALIARAASLSLLPQMLSGGGFVAEGPSGFCAAHSAALDPGAGEAWLAVGDAALGFDPLSSQGLFNALYTGLAAAEAVNRALDGDVDAVPGYRTGLASIGAAYKAHLRGWYRLEQRWAERPFWERRVTEGLAAK